MLRQGSVQKSSFSKVVIDAGPVSGLPVVGSEVYSVQPGGSGLESLGAVCH